MAAIDIIRQATHEGLERVRDGRRLAALERLQVVDTAPEPQFDRLTRVALAATDADTALLSLVTGDAQFFKSRADGVANADAARATPLSQSFCQYVVASGAALVVADATADPVLCTNGGLTDLGVHAYLGVPVRDADGNVLGTLCVLGAEPREWTDEHVDVVADLAAVAAHELARREHELELEAREERIRRLLNTLDAVVWEADAETWASTFVSQQIETLLGYTAEQWLSTQDLWESCLHPDDRAAVVAESHAAILAGRSHTSEYRMVRSNGRLIWVRDHVQVVAGADGRPRTIRGVMVDVTSAKQAEIERREADERYRTLVEHAPICTYLADVETLRITYMSPHVQAMLGYSPDEWAEAPTLVEHCLHPEDRDAVKAEAMRARAAGEPFRMEYRMIARDGRTVWVYGVTVLVRDDLGQPLVRQGFLVDITEIRATQDALRASEARIRALVDNSTDLIAIIGANGTYRFASESHRRQLGRDPQELVGTQSLELVHPADAQATAAAVSAALDGAPPRTVRVRLAHADGGWRTFEGVAKRLEESGGRRGAMLIGRDITARLAAEAASERYASQLKMLASASIDMTVTRTVEQIVQLAADASRDIVGVHAAVSAVVEEERWAQAIVAPSLSDKYARWRSYDAAPTGEGIYRLVVERNEPLRLSRHELLAHPAWRGFSGHADAHPPLEGLLAAPVIAADGRNLGLIQVTDKVDGTDFTASDEAILVQLAQAMAAAVERAQLEERLRHAQKMEAIGQLAGGVAHDFNNLLTAINGYSDIGLNTDDPERMRASLREVAAAGERAAALTRQLLTFSRKHVTTPEVVRVDDEIAGVLRMLTRMIGEHIVVESHVDPAAAPVHADRALLGQVLLNLATNARDAMPGGGRLTIRVDDVVVGAEGAEAGAVAPGRYTCLSVADTGIGMDEDVRARATEPFFTTKPPGSGTGLGLATVHGIVGDSGGALSIESAPGRGTTIRVYLPAVEGRYGSRTHEAAHGATGAEPRPRGHRVLLVEDEDVVRALVTEFLLADGYDVTATGSPLEALTLFEESAFDILVTDVVMPGMSGPELVRRLGAQAPPVLYTSGYTGDERTRHGLDDHVAFLQKPFAGEALSTCVANLLRSEDDGAAAA